MQVFSGYPLDLFLNLSINPIALDEHHGAKSLCPVAQPGLVLVKRQHVAGAEHGDETMTQSKLTNHQTCVLRAAAHSANLAAWPVPQRLGLNKGSTTIVIKGLLRRGLVEERPALGDDPIWRVDDTGRKLTVVITRMGLAAVGVMQVQHEADPQENADNPAQSGPTPAVSESQRRMPRAGTKLAILVALLKGEEGAAVEEMAAATGWQTHTVRGVMSGALATKFGLRIVSEKVEGRGRVYRIKDAMEADADEVNGARE
jgi:hypothetical protein